MNTYKKILNEKISVKVLYSIFDLITIILALVSIYFYVGRNIKLFEVFLIVTCCSYIVTKKYNKEMLSDK